MALEWVMTYLRSPGQPLCQAWASDISSNKKMIADANLHIKYMYLYMYIKLEKFYEKKNIMACNNFTEQVYKILYLQTDRFGDFNTTIKNLFENFIWRGFNNVFQFLCKGTSIHVHVRCMFMQKLIWACFYTYFLVLFLLCVYWDTQEEQCQDSLLNEKKKSHQTFKLNINVFWLYMHSFYENDNCFLISVISV